MTEITGIDYLQRLAEINAKNAEAEKEKQYPKRNSNKKQHLHQKK